MTKPLQIPRNSERQQEKTKALYRELGFTAPDALDSFIEGNRLFTREQFDGAVEAYTRALEIQPDFAEAMFERARARRRLEGGLEEAISDYRALSSLCPRHAAVRLVLAEALVLAQRYGDALIELGSVSRFKDQGAAADRLFWLVFQVAAKCGLGTFPERDAAAIDRLSLSDGELLRPEWYTFNSLRVFLAKDGFLPGASGEEFRNWFRDCVEARIDDTD